jgi:plastocyanin
MTATGTAETVRRKGVLVTAAVVVVAAVAVALLPMLASSSSNDVRAIDIVVRDMAFYVGDDPTPNPEILFKAGERVRVRVRNEDAGMRHDFTIKAWAVATKMLEDRGEEDVVEFQVPDTPGLSAYACTPHPRMMTGTIRVE